MKLTELKSFAEEMSTGYPQLNNQIRDFYFLALSEVEDGESEENECELAYSDIMDLIKDQNKTSNKSVDFKREDHPYSAESQSNK